MTDKGLDVHVDLNKFSSQVKGTDKKFAAALKREVRAALTQSGAEMLADVRGRASWSSRIGSATSIKTTFSEKRAKVVIVVNARQAPHARGLELGNKNVFNETEIAKRTKTVQVGSRRVQVGRAKAMKAMKKSGMGVGRALRHPVFDSKHPPTRVGEQPIRPFFFPAASSAAPGVQRRMEAALDTIARAAGFN
jgi:hypothetical protein